MHSKTITVISTCLFVLLSFHTYAQKENKSIKIQFNQGSPDIEWDASFTRTEGWTGGDAAGSVDLGDGRVLWMFADSWIGDVALGKHAPGSNMVNNVIAIHNYSSLGKCRAPHYRDVKFFWGPENEENKPTAWIIPDDKPESEWYWSNGSGVVIPGPSGKNRLVIFLFRVTSKGEEGTVWNFKGTGSAMAIIDNMSEPVENWKARQVQIPYNYVQNPTSVDSTLRICSWGVSTYYPEIKKTKKDVRYVYLYGIDETDPWDKKLLLARVDVFKIDNLSSWEYYSDGNIWSPDPAKATPIAGGMVSEISVDEVNYNGQTKLVLVQSEPFFGKSILVRTSSNPEGPWTEPEVVYNIPGLDQGKEYFTYAAKGHHHLSCPGKLLITYIINSNDFWEMASDATIYRPRFVNVPIDLILKN